MLTIAFNTAMAFGLKDLDPVAFDQEIKKLYQAGKYQQALKLAKIALGLRELKLEPDHPELALSLNNLAAIYETIGLYEKAVPLYQRAREIFEKELGPDHPVVAGSLNNLGGLYHAIGVYEKAEAMLKEALAIREQVILKKEILKEVPRLADHLAVAQSLNNLGELYRTLSAYEKAEPMFLRALEIREKASDQLAVATSLSNLAGLYYAIGLYEKPELLDLVKAELLYQRALAIREKELGPDHPHVAKSLNNLGLLYRDFGDYKKAEPILQRALAIKEKELGPDHPDVATSLTNLADLEAAQQHYRAAVGLFKKGLAIEERMIQNVFTFTTEEQQLAFIRSISADYDVFLSLIQQQFIGDRERMREGFELVLHRKGVVFDAKSEMGKALRARLSKPVQKDLDRLAELRSDYSQLMLNKPESLSAEQYREELALLRQQIEQSEQRLATVSALVAKVLQQRNITVDALSQALPKNAALVEFVKFLHYNFTIGRFMPSWRYLAFVLTREGEVKLADLGDAGTIDAMVQRMRRSIRRFVPRDPVTSEQAYKSLKEFYAKVWAPLENYLGMTDQVFISPDGSLNLVPFAALMDGEGRSLVERYRIAYVTSGRELAGSMQDTIQPESELLLVANPAFDQTVRNPTTPDASLPALRSREIGGTLKFRPLRGTASEAVDIPPLVAGQEMRKRALTDIHATEAAVKAARSPRVLHLATHGFFLKDIDRSLDGSRRGTAGQYENPLVRSGLALAGANRAAEVTEGEDGLLTALEVSGMDLHGTELVVLSACETAVGDVQTGEGVFGLRRAFALAGAKNLLMSLWKVDDETTARQMIAFYRNLQTLPPAEALRQAQRDTIKELKAKYDGLAPPKLWAPFILQGAHALGP